jgi:CO dehydrogenase/acetyl-CoA synthase alpha subunit
MVVDEILEVDPVTGKALKARMAVGVQFIEEIGDLVVVHYVDEDYVMQRLEIPRREVTASEEIDLEKLREAIARRVEELRARKERARKLEKLVGFKAEKAKRGRE